MTTNIGQSAPVFWPGEPRSLTEKPRRPQYTELQRVRHLAKRPCMHRRKILLACGSSDPMRVEREGGAAGRLVGTLVAPSVQGHSLPPCRSYGPIRVFFQASCMWQSEGLSGQSFSVALPIQALRGFPCLGSFSVDQTVRHLKQHPGWGPAL